MSDSALVLPPLSSLFRKAAIDAGFNLEPEREGEWWLVRASGVPGVVWLRPEDGTGVLLALSSLLGATDFGSQSTSISSLPAGAAGALLCSSPASLHAVLQRVWTQRRDAPALMEARLAHDVDVALSRAGLERGSPAATEAITEIRRRIGQDLFREGLLDYWEGRCAVTALAVRALLRASHAKPWSDATDVERLDVYNGLLLAPHLDVLFDQGFLSFDDDGKAIASPQLAARDWQLLGIDPATLRLRRIDPRHRPYLRYHRLHVLLD